MLKVRHLALLLAAVLAVGNAMVAVAHDGPKFEAELTGSQEVPARVTDATGKAEVRFRDSSTAEFKLEVEDIRNVVQAHIHCGAPGVNGPVVVFLYGPVAASQGEIEGRIAEGTFTAADVIARPSSAECPGGVANLAELQAKMVGGNTYANVHTDDGRAPANTGPGDFPGGEVRGLLVVDED